MARSAGTGRKGGRKKTKGRAPARTSPRLWPPKLGIVLLRVYVGCVFFQAVHHKLWGTRMAARPDGLDLSLREALAHFSDTDYVDLLRQAIAEPPVIDLGPIHWRMDGYAAFLEHVMLPGQVPYIAGAAILGFELFLAVSLVFGIGLRLMAFLGAGMMVFFGLAKATYFWTVGSTNWLLAFALLALSLGAAGRIWGVDARLSRRWPGWIS